MNLCSPLIVYCFYYKEQSGEESEDSSVRHERSHGVTQSGRDFPPGFVGCLKAVFSGQNGLPVI